MTRTTRHVAPGDVTDRISNDSVSPAGSGTRRARFIQNVRPGGVASQAVYSGRGNNFFPGNGAINHFHAQNMSFASPGADSYLMGDNRAGDHAISHDQQQLRPSHGRPHNREAFRIAIICPLAPEFDAVCLLFDESWDDVEDYGRACGDPNFYANGRIGQFDVVVLLLSSVGAAAEAGAVASFRSSYQNLQLAFVVGTCGGVPTTDVNEIHLGDVVISNSVVQYDLGEQCSQNFVVKDTIEHGLRRSNTNIRSLMKSFETDDVRKNLQETARPYLTDLQKAAAKKRRKQNYQYPGIDLDKLFIAAYQHKHMGPQQCGICNSSTAGFCEQAAKTSCAELGCDQTNVVDRMGPNVMDRPNGPEIFVGRIASETSVIKSGEYRDRIAQEQGVVALMMEGAGIWNETPCIVIKGVSNYADSHKNDLWQGYAAATAASVLKAVLGRLMVTDR